MKMMKGHGDYKAVQAQAASTIQKALKSAMAKGLRAGGGMLGGMAGAKLGHAEKGANMGRAVGAKLSKLLGSGDYDTNTDSVAVNSLFKGSGPKSASFETTASGVRLKHREYIQDIFLQSTVGQAFNNSQFNVNPGLASVFPYLSQIASNFEQYRFHGLVFEFVSTTSQYGQTALGNSIAAMQYNVGSPAFQSKQTMENSDYAISARLDRNVMYGIECAPGTQAQNYFYIRAPGVPVTTPQLFDLGLMQFATNTATVAAAPGLVSGSSVGELWVTYDVELIRPRISPGRYGYLHVQASTPLPASPLGSVARQTIGYGTLQLAGADINPTTLTLRNVTVGDTYMIVLQYKGTIAAAPIFPSLTLTGAVFTNLFYADADSFAAVAPLPATATSMVQVYIITITADQPVIPSIAFGLAGSYPGGLGGLAQVDLVMTNLANGLSPTLGTL